MFIDASALCAMLTNEEDADELLKRMSRHSTRITSPLAVWETVVSVSRILTLPIAKTEQVVCDYLQLTNIAVVSVPPQAAYVAIEAFERFGKGKHEAKLNFGDCFSYACARFYGMALLYKGNDFALTDIEAA